MQRLLMALMFSGIALSFGANEVSLVTAEPAIEIITLTGYTRAKARMQLVTEVSGRCLAVHADVGDTVEGGIFGQLDGTFTTLELEQNATTTRQIIWKRS